MFFTIWSLLTLAGASAVRFTEIGADVREELSLEETAKTDIIPANHHA
jgi:hypothetical protein